MIKNLLIKNYALIRHLQMEPSPRFNTVTGETGAGKSIMLGALGLLLGNRADTKVLFEEDQKCVIEGTFNISDHKLRNLFQSFELDYHDETIIRREISPAGKSRAFVNDTPVTLDVMQTIGNFLVDIHSQRDTYLLGASSYQLRMIDGYAQNSQTVASYKAIYVKYAQQQKAYFALEQQAAELNKESDFNKFLLDELDKAELNEGEYEELEEELQIIEHAEEIKSKLFECVELTEHSEFSVNSGLEQVLKNISQISRIAEHYGHLRTRTESCLLELRDIAKEIESESQKVDFDPERHEQVRERLGLIYQLAAKHQVQSDRELTEIREELRLKVDKALNIDDELAHAKKQLDLLYQDLTAAGKTLTESRISCFTPFKNELEKLLKELAMPFAKIDFRHQTVDPGENGTDKISVLFSANAGITPDELKNVASGGEFSRLMFCIKYILAGKTSLPTIVFDEIDTGISGEIALKMMVMMKESASRHQIIAITHLPQIAAGGDTHYFVFKENDNGKSLSTIKKLLPEERKSAIAKMIGGDRPSAAALVNAQELLSK